MTYAFAKAFADPRLPAGLRARKRHAYARITGCSRGHTPDAGQRAPPSGRMAIAFRHDPRIARELSEAFSGSGQRPPRRGWR